MTESTLSRPMLDPCYQRLGAAIVIQAARDLTSSDPLKALDALTWLLWGDDEVFECLDIDPERAGLDILRTIQRSEAKYGKKHHKLTRLIGYHHR